MKQNDSDRLTSYHSGIQRKIDQASNRASEKLPIYFQIRVSQVEMIINIIRLSNQRVLRLTGLRSTDTIESVKQKVMNETGIHTQAIRLCIHVGDRRMLPVEDGRLSDHGIRNESYLYLVPRIRGGALIKASVNQEKGEVSAEVSEGNPLNLIIIVVGILVAYYLYIQSSN